MDKKLSLMYIFQGMKKLHIETIRGCASKRKHQINVWSPTLQLNARCAEQFRKTVTISSLDARLLKRSGR